jgi:ABC-type branched-subunit amino acid transport system substrate-binding protein
MVTKMKQVLGGSLTGKRFAIARNQSASIDSFAAIIQAATSKEGFTIVDTENMTNGAPSFASQAAKIAAAKVDGVFMLAIFDDTITQAKALAAAGFNGPIIELHSGNSPSVFKAIALDNFYAARPSPVPQPGDALYKLAEANGFTSTVQNDRFPLGYTAGAIIAKALQECASPCSNANLNKALEGIHNLTIPEGASFGPITFTPDQHQGGTTFMFYKWSSADGKEVPSGQPIVAGP